MIHNLRSRPALWLTILAAACSTTCATPESSRAREEPSAAPAPATTGSADRAVEPASQASEQALLRQLFPEIQGTITRESIAGALAAERARAPGGSSAPAADANAPADAGLDAATRDRRAQASAAIERGDYGGARRILGELLVEQQWAEARDLLARGDARGALAILDQAVDIAPRDARVRCTRGAAALLVGSESFERELVESALADYLGVARESDSAEAWLGASRCARWIQDLDAALEYARNGLRAWQRDGGKTVLDAPPERTLAEASFDAYLRARAAAPEPPRASAAEASAGEMLPASAEAARARTHFTECKTTLEALIARLPGDPWAWQRLSALIESEGLLAEARSIALRGLNEGPGLTGDEELHQRLASASTSLGGRAALLATYAEFKARHPDVALAEWYPAVAHFDTAVEGLLGQSPGASAERPGASADRLGASVDRPGASADRPGTSTDRASPGAGRADADASRFAAARAAFESAEKGFARCRALNAKFGDACRSYELLCRDGAGWCAFHSGDLEAAQKSFLSMEDLVLGGLAAELERKIPSGIVGLHWVGGAYAARAQSENSLASLESLERAGKVYDFLHEYQPENASWANDSGFFNRDTAVALERKAQALADQGKIDEANRLLARARELMDKSYRAYVDAARLAPEDAAIQNDTGLILTYYLQRDVERALAYLKRAQELGEKQVPELAREAAAPDLTPEEREARERRLEVVETALGDAYQNLGVLALTLNGDPKTARMWLEKSLVTGQDAREEVSGKGGYLEQCDEAVAGRRNPLVTDKTRWGAPKSSKSEKRTN